MFIANTLKTNRICGQSTPQKIADDIFSKMDKNHDQSITPDEFAVGADKDATVIKLLQCADDKDDSD